MTNVFFFDLRDGESNNFNNLQSEKYLLWDKKSKKWSVGDLFFIYHRKSNILLSTKLVEEDIKPFNKDNKWFVKFEGTRYEDKEYEVMNHDEKYNDFVVFEKFKSYSVEEDLTTNAQGGYVLINQEKKTKFKEKKCR